MKKLSLFLFATLLLSYPIQARWGFFAHRLINRMSVMLLPPEMFGLFKDHIDYLTDRAVAPDERRYAVDWEAPRHYIDIDVYGDSALYHMPHQWEDAVAQYSEDTLMAYGIAPWNILTMKQRLTKAFTQQDLDKILLLAAELGHYVGDAHVPLHTTENYNGQLTNQYGIHGFWESRLPELFSEDYDFFLSPVQYVEKPLELAWQTIEESHLALDSVLFYEKMLSQQLGDDRKFGYETRNGINVQTYTPDFSKAYHLQLKGQVERRMRCAIQCTANLWYTCWIDAGQPSLEELRKNQRNLQLQMAEDEERQQWKHIQPHGRVH